MIKNMAYLMSNKQSLTLVTETEQTNQNTEDIEIVAKKFAQIDKTLPDDGGEPAGEPEVQVSEIDVEMVSQPSSKGRRSHRDSVLEMRAKLQRAGQEQKINLSDIKVGQLLRYYKSAKGDIPVYKEVEDCHVLLHYVIAVQSLNMLNAGGKSLADILLIDQFQVNLEEELRMFLANLEVLGSWP